MKNALFSLFLLSTSPLYSQDYIPLIQENAHWQVMQDLDATLWDFDRFYAYTLGQDSIIENTGYTTVWARDFFSTNEPGGLATYPQPFEASDPILYALIREDLIAKTIFCRLIDVEMESGFSDEFLLYDFNLAVGDEIYDNVVDAGPYSVTSLDTIFIHGAVRQVWTLDEGTEIIEGIGSSLGLLEGITLLISGGNTDLHRYCQGTDMDCNVAVEGLINVNQQHNIEHFVFFPDASSVETGRYRLVDTVITNGHTYFELHRGQSQGFESVGQDPTSPSVGYGYLFREENRKIYRLQDTTERLVYDFSMEAGDSITYNIYPNDEKKFHLVEIDSITISDGSKCATYLLWNLDDEQEMTWIEGIGETRHSFYPEYAAYPNNDALQYTLLCYYDDYNLPETYQNPDAISCYISVDTKDESNHLTPISVFPNPSSHTIHLDTPIENGTFLIRNATGQLVKQFTINEKAFDISSLPSGYYFYEIYNSTKQALAKGKLIKQ